MIHPALCRPSRLPQAILLLVACIPASISFAQQKPGKLTIVAFGDSTTAPRTVDGQPLVVYADLLRRELPARGFEAQVINAGVPGNATDDAKKRFESDVLAHQPDLVIIQFGANDSAVDVWRNPPATAPRVPIDEFEANLRRFVGALRQRGCRVILMTPDPFRWTDKLKELYGKPPYDPDDPEGFSVLLDEYAQRVRRVAREEKVALVDAYAAFEDFGDREGRSVDELLLDGMHPNAEGHRLIADLLLGEIAK